MLELVFLGTGGSAPTIQRGLPAQMVLYRDERFLVECGEGTQRQILRSGLGFRRLQRVLLTHGHLDHILGLGGLISTFARWESVDSVEICGSRRTLDRVGDLVHGVVLRGARLPIRLELVNVKPGTLYESSDFEIKVFSVTHRGPGSVGYVFAEKPRRPFLADKAAALGVPAGPERRDLVNGKAIVLDDGTEIKPDQVLGVDRPGVSVAITGDIARTDNISKAIQGVDVIVTEATYMHQDAKMAKRFGHLTALEAAKMAQKAGSRMLVLSHISQRYRIRDILAEARAVFPDTIVARDFDRLVITRDKLSLNHEELTEDNDLPQGFTETEM